MNAFSMRSILWFFVAREIFGLGYHMRTGLDAGRQPSFGIKPPRTNGLKQSFRKVRAASTAALSTAARVSTG
jgi:hypothetical protein